MENHLCQYQHHLSVESSKLEMNAWCRLVSEQLFVHGSAFNNCYLRCGAKRKLNLIMQIEFFQYSILARELLYLGFLFTPRALNLIQKWLGFLGQCIAMLTEFQLHSCIKMSSCGCDCRTSGTDCKC